ncbi:two pore calcium channel protein 1-like [Daphnia pulex]|uniref:two pore calcium channel protein 1-like n=1 Tax=Daphnia pulex TaxID=6669 RepID=UPI001EE0B1A2|nr:two pore calcium channel protein 1-like [Daphnia pulex]
MGEDDKIISTDGQIIQIQIMEEADESDVPLEVGNTARTASTVGESAIQLQFTELHSFPAIERLPLVEVTKSWELNYREAAIFLEEGINNDKLTSHPSCHEALPAYLLVHNKWYYALDFAASLLLILLTFTEKPANPLFRLPVGVHSSMELTALVIVSVELIMKFRWVGFKIFIHHPRSMVKAVTLLIMIAESILVLVRQSSHFRVTRALRPIFLLDNHHFGGVRRYLRQVLQSMPPAIDMLGLLLFVILFYSVLGFYLFGSNVNDPYFSTLQQAFISLFILLTTANFPDVMMPSYAVTRWSCVFFITYLSMVLYFLMNLLLAAVYASFSSMEKNKFQQLLLHRRKAAQHAFRLLLGRNNRFGITLQHFRGLLRHVDSSRTYREVYLMFRLLNTSESGIIDVNEFYHIYDVLDTKWRVRDEEPFWFSRLRSPTLAYCAQQVHRLVTWNFFDYFVSVVIFLGGILMLTRTAAISVHMSNPLELGVTWETYAYVSFYTLEACLKIFGMGSHDYFTSGWNCFDFTVTGVSLIGLAAEILGHWSFLVVARHLRILRLFKLRKRYRDVFGTIFILGQRLLCAGIVFFILYYAYSIVGMELFAEYDLTNCCKNSTVEANFRYENGSSSNGYYYLNNFENVISSYVTLFELTVINNWYIIMEGYALTTTQWSRIYFMCFYLTIMMLLSIVVASVLDGFMFRISYKEQMTKEDEKRLVEKTVTLNAEEYERLLAVESAEEKSRGKVWYNWFARLRKQEPFRTLDEVTLDLPGIRPISVTFTGFRRRTKDVLLSFMYKDEISCWMKQADHEEKQPQSGTSPSKRVGVRQRLNRGSDDNLTD